MYGVDQCRVCGTPIHMHSPTMVEDQEKANRFPPIPEKEWRRRGYMCPPTRFQLYINPADGCCQPCARREIRRKYHMTQRMIVAVGGATVVFAAITIVLTYMRH